MDGSYGKHKYGVGAVLITPEGDKIELAKPLEFECTNNEAAIEGLHLAVVAGVKKVGSVQ